MIKFTGIVSLLASTLLMAEEVPVVFPAAPLSEVVTDYHGTKVSDPYRGLEDSKNAKNTAWAKAYASASMKALKAMPGRDQWVSALEKAGSELGTSVYGVHRAKSGTIYYFARHEGGQLAKFYRRKPGETAEVLLDPASLEKEGGYVSSIKRYSISPNETYFACTITSGGDEMASLHLFDMKSRKRLGTPIPRVRWGSARWLTDESGFFYSQLQELTPGMSRQQLFQKSQMRFHKIDGRKRGETDRSYLGVGLDDGTEIADADLPFIQTYQGSDWITALITTGVSSDHGIYITKASSLLSGKGKWKKVCDREQKAGASYGGSLAFHDGKLYLITRHNAPNGKLVVLHADAPDFSKAETVYAPEKGVLKSLVWARDGMYLKVLEGGPSHYVALPFKDLKSPVMIKTPEAGRVRSESGSPEQDGIVFNFASWKSPKRIYSASIAEPEAKLISFAGQKMPAVCTDLVQETVQVKSHDGEMVNMSLVYRKGLVKNGKNPVLLIGYGSYGTVMEPNFWDSDGPLLERGVIKAVAHIRGGGAYGERWRLGGYQETKPNTWKDFIACAEALVEKKYASAKTICASGRSAGGITVGRAITEKPEAFGAAIIGVGLVDVVRAETTPNGVPNIPEFGSVKTEKGFRSIFAMSAYHHVKKGVRYPPVLLFHGANDTRVEPWQSMKLTARLHAAVADLDNPPPVLLRIDYATGHGSGATVNQRNELSADLNAFMFKYCTLDR